MQGCQVTGSIKVSKGAKIRKTSHLRLPLGAMWLSAVCDCGIS